MNVQNNKKYLINNAFFRTTLRSSGYNTIQAIADIIDNSMEENVNASHIDIRLITKNDKLESIEILDDGNGMNIETMEQCVTLGSQTGKGEDTLGKYGIGSKSATLSFAQQLVIISKQKNNNKSNLCDFCSIGELDVSMPTGTYDINAPIIQKAYMEKVDKIDKNKIDTNSKSFKKLLKYEHGTLVKATKIDRITIQDPSKLFADIISELGIIYSVDLSKRNISMQAELINNGKVKCYSFILPKDWTGESFGASELIGTGKIGKTNLTYKAYYVNDDISVNKLDAFNSLYVGRSPKYRGLFFVRNGRLLTNYGIDFDFIASDGHNSSTASNGYNCFRCIIEMTGNEDSMIGVSYTKILNGFNGISQQIKDDIIKTLSPLVQKAKEIDDKKKIAFRMSDEGTKQILKSLSLLNKILGSCVGFLSKLEGLAIHIKTFNHKSNISKQNTTAPIMDNNVDKNNTHTKSTNEDRNDKKNNNNTSGLLKNIYEVNKGPDSPYITFPEFGVVEINRDHIKYLNLMAICGEEERQREIMNIASGMYARKMVENEIGKPLDDIFDLYEENLDNIEGKCLEIIKPYSDKRK